MLLDADESLTSEKEASPNQSLKGFDVIESIKFELEKVCPGVVSCADVLVLAAREAVLMVNSLFWFDTCVHISVNLESVSLENSLRLVVRFIRWKLEGETV